MNSFRQLYDSSSIERANGDTAEQCSGLKSIPTRNKTPVMAGIPHAFLKDSAAQWHLRYAESVFRY